MKKKNAILSALKFSVYSMCMMLGIMLAACSDAEEFSYILSSRNLERTLLAVPSVEDTIGSSVLHFEQTATLKDESSGTDISLKPTALVHIGLSTPVIYVKSADDLPIRLLRSYVESEVPYASGLTFGKDVTKIFEYSDSVKAKVDYTWRYKGFVTADGDTIASPHTEITDVEFDGFDYAKDGEATEVIDPYRMSLFFNAKFATKGTSTDEVDDMVKMSPSYKKIISKDTEVVEKVDYSGKYTGCPYNVYELTEKVKTNKREFTLVHKAKISFNLNGPKAREQPAVDSLYNAVSKDNLSEVMLSEVYDEQGFKMRTMTGTYVSSNTGKSQRTIVESTVNFTYQFPVKFESQYGSYNIPAINIAFEELGFKVTKSTEDNEYKRFNTVNSVVPKVGTCHFDVIDEKVLLLIAKEKPKTVVAVDSTYTLTGSGDEYKVEKKVTYSDKTTRTSTYSYTGRHEASAVAFGEVHTSNLAWTADKLKKGTQTTATDEKKFSSITKFSVVYTTTLWTSAATNGVQSGTFAFREMVPTVTFVDGNISKSFPIRTYVLTDQGAKIATNYNIVERNGVSYKAYAYNYTALAKFSTLSTETLTSLGYLLLPADEKGQPTYNATYSWSGNTYTAKVVKKTPHTYAEDEVDTYVKSVTISLSDLGNGQVTADNTNFKATETHTEKHTSVPDKPWTVTNYTTDYTHVVSNGTDKRTLSNTLKDAVIAFDDGVFKHTFNVRAKVDLSEKFGSSTREGNYDVTPHNLTMTATVDTKTLLTTGTTNIYVKRQAQVSGHTERTVVYADGTVDGEVKITFDDGTSETIKASDTFGSRFAFDFTNVSAQEKTVSNVKYKASGNVGTMSSSNVHKKGAWNVTEKVYPYNHVLDNGVATDKISATYSFKNYEFSYTDSRIGTVKLPIPQVTMSHKSLNITDGTADNSYTKYNANVVVNGQASATSGSYSKDLPITHVLKIKKADEPETPHLGKPKAFYAAASFDPDASSVTKRAFCFVWEDGVTYAVCSYGTMLPQASDFMYKKDTYQGYNSVGYDPDNAQHWQPARGVRGNGALYWYRSDGSLMSALTDGDCMFLGWKNIVKGKYDIIIPGYTYTIDGYVITITAPNGQKVSFNSHYKP